MQPQIHSCPAASWSVDVSKHHLESALASWKMKEAVLSQRVCQWLADVEKLSANRFKKKEVHKPSSAAQRKRLLTCAETSFRAIYMSRATASI